MNERLAEETEPALDRAEKVPQPAAQFVKVQSATGLIKDGRDHHVDCIRGGSRFQCSQDRHCWNAMKT